jgi:hypothetical protein
VTSALHTLRPIAQRWGGGPRNEECGVEGFGADPSTMLRMVPLPTSFARWEERK